MKFLKQEKILSSLVIVSLLFTLIFTYIVSIFEETTFESEFIKFILAIFISILAAFIFYIFQVYLPEQKRNKIIKNNLNKRYLQFKQDSISIFLSVLKESASIECIEKLCDVANFREFFKKTEEDHRTKWDKVLDEMDEYELKQLLIEFEILHDEIFYVLNTVKIDDEEVYSFYKRLKEGVYRLRYINLEFEGVDVLFDFFWEIFAGWSFVTGYRNDDIIEFMIKKIK
jgi:hypothetical protein